MRQNMRLVTELQNLVRRDFEVAQASLINPDSSPGSAAAPQYVLDGEFLGFNNDYKLSREGVASAAKGGQSVNPAAAGGVRSYPFYAVFMERGRSDVQAISRLMVLMGGFYEADFSANVLNSADTFEVGDELFVNWLSDGSDINRRCGLTKLRNGSDGLVVGHVTRVYPAGSDYVIRASINVG
jgi:hypothetical protein